MKIAILGDTHFGIRNDAPFMLDFQEKFYKDVFFPYLLQNDIKNVIQLGDLMDRRKYSNHVTAVRMKNMFLDPMKNNNIHMDVYPGNHDVYHKNTNEVNTLDIFLSGYDNVTQIHEPMIKEFDGLKFMFLPWISEENYQQSMDFVKNNSANYCVAHLELNGFETQAGNVHEGPMTAESFSKFDEVWTGHFHHRSKKGNIHYLGTPYEMNWGDHDDQKGFHVFDTETRQLTFIQNPHSMYVKIHYEDESMDDKIKYREMDLSCYNGKQIRLFVKKKTSPAIFENFVDRLYKQEILDLTIIEDMSEFHNDNVDVENLQTVSTKELMEKYVDNADTDMDKARLKSLLNNLYIEALHVGMK